MTNLVKEENMDTVESMKTLKGFVAYCRSFYSIEFDGDNGAIYPFATNSEIMDACIAHMINPNPAFPFDGDSTDREAVRDLILAKRKLTGHGETDFDKAVANCENRRW